MSAVGLALSGCSAVGPAAPADSSGRGWKEPASYDYTLRSTCGERNLLGTYRITVAAGEVTNVQGLDDHAQVVLSDDELRGEMPTLTALLREVAAARAEGADIVEVTSDRGDGHPIRINVDYRTAATDDEACYVITGYTVGEGAHRRGATRAQSTPG
jgi:hypothetical protein